MATEPLPRAPPMGRKIPIIQGPQRGQANKLRPKGPSIPCKARLRRYLGPGAGSSFQPTKSRRELCFFTPSHNGPRRRWYTAGPAARVMDHVWHCHAVLFRAIVCAGTPTTPAADLRLISSRIARYKRMGFHYQVEDYFMVVAIV